MRRVLIHNTNLNKLDPNLENELCFTLLLNSLVASDAFLP